MTHTSKGHLSGLFRFVPVCLLLTLSAFFMPAQAAAPDAGTIISNISSASFYDEATARTETVTSNEVRATVNPVPDFTLSPDQRLLRAPGDDVLFAFEIISTGNTSVEVFPSLSAFAGDFEVFLPVLALDGNRDGFVTPGEELGVGASLTLAPGEAASLLVAGTVSELANSGEEAQAVLTVDAPGSAGGTSLAEVPKTLTSRAIIEIDEPSIALSKRVSSSVAFAGDELTYTLSVENDSALPVQTSDTFGGETVTVDDAVVDVFLVKDILPVHTEFVAFVDNVDFVPVYHRRGDDEYRFVSVPPADFADIDAIAFYRTSDFQPGEFRELMFSVRVLETALDGTLVNQAVVPLPQSGGGLLAVESNTVSTIVSDPAGGSGIIIHGNPGYSDPVSQVRFSDPIYIEVNSGLCNATSLVDEIYLVLETSPTGDRETVLAVETGPNTGVFRVGPIDVVEGGTVNVGDGILSANENDTLTATPQCDPDVVDSAPVEQTGYVFLSVTNDPVPDATVILVDEFDIVVNSTTSDAFGKFRLDIPADGTYRVQVENPYGYLSPSSVTVFTGYGRTVDLAGSYGEPFTGEGGASVGFDIPVDPPSEHQLTVSKTADRQTVRSGQLLRYDVEVRNSALVDVDPVTVTDDLPAGFIYVPGSALLDEVIIADPEILNVSRLQFNLGRMGPVETVKLSYRVRAGASAGEGEKINTAWASAPLGSTSLTARSNVAQATVRLDNAGSVFSTEGTILGKVFADCDLDGYQDEDEPGIAGVQIFTEEGTSVVTDLAGRYSLPRMTASTHVLDIYESTLPEGAEVLVTRVMDAGSAGSRFVPLAAGEVRSEDFAVKACETSQLQEIELRKARLKEKNKGLDKSPMQLDNARRQDFVQEYEKSVETALETDRLSEKAGQSVSALVKVAATRDLQVELGKHEPGLGFVDLSNGDIVASRQISVRIKGPDKGGLALRVNGEEIGAERMGQSVKSREPYNIQLKEYIAIELRPGENTMTVEQRDGFGNMRGSETISVSAPGEPVKVAVMLPQEMTADPAARHLIRLQVQDEHGLPTGTPAEVTLSADDGDWRVDDFRPDEPGLQVFLANGEGEATYQPSGLVGTHTLNFRSSWGTTRLPVSFETSLDQPPVMTGYIEGVARFSEGGDDLSQLIETDNLSMFEETREGVNGQVYLKGKIRGEALLTLRYDSEADEDAGLFRDIEPDRFYPVYGDQSERGFDARSRGNLFVKLEKGLSYLLYGDVRYEASNPSYQLGAYQRSLEGAKAHYENDRISVDLYAAQTSTGQVVVEIPGAGVSGPYALDFNDVVENSERVEILVRDRDQPSVIVSTELLTRFTSYTLDYFDRSIIFTSPVPITDENFNPVSIRVTFETDENGGEDYWVYGADGQYRMNDETTIGYRELHSDAPRETADGRRTVRAAFAEYRPDENTQLQLEIAQTEYDKTETNGTVDPATPSSGEAARVSFNRVNGRNTLSGRIGYTSDGFNAPGAGQSPGSVEARLNTVREMNAKTVLSAEAIYSDNTVQDRLRYGAVGRVQRKVAPKLDVRAGARVAVAEDASGVQDELISVLLGGNWAPAFLGGASLEGEIEQALDDGDDYRVSLGADYAFTPKARAYLKSEWSSSDRGTFGIGEGTSSNTNIKGGIEYRLAENVQMFSEYRANSGVWDGGLANGITANWSPGDDWSLRGRIEHVEALSETYRANSAAGAGITWEPEGGNTLLSGDVELSKSNDGQESWYLNNAAGYRTEDTTLLVRNRYAQNNQGDNLRTRNRLRAGAAWRPQDREDINALAWYEYGLENDGVLEEENHIWSLAAEYKPSEDMRVRPRYAGQVWSYDGGPFQDHSTLHMGQLGFDRDVTRRINLGANLALFTDDDFDVWTAGAGAELSVYVMENTLLGLGYNYTELKDPALGNLYQDGFHVRMRMKVDQNSWNIFAGE